MHALILHNYHSIREWGSARHSVSEDRKLKQIQAHGIKSGEFAVQILGFFWLHRKRTAALSRHNSPKWTLLTCTAKSISPLMFSAGSMRSKMSWMWWAKGRWYDVPEAKLVICSRTLLEIWEKEHQKSDVTEGSSGTAALPRSPFVTAPEMSPDVDRNRTTAAVLWTRSPGLETPLVCSSWPSVLHPQLNRYKRLYKIISNFIFNEALAGFHCYWFKRQ